MNRFENLKIKQKLLAVILVVMFGFLMFGAYAFTTINYLKVNGPIYSEIVQGKDLIADILPPPDYIIESYLVAFELTHETDKTVLDQKIDYLQNKLEKEYNDRHEYWVQNLPEGQLKKAMVEDSYDPAQEFYGTVNAEFIPAIKAGNLRKADDLINGSLKQSYEKHRKYIDQVVSMATDQNAESEEFAKGEILKRTISLAIVALLSILAGLFLFNYVTSKVIENIVRTKDMLKDISEGEGDLTKRLDADYDDEIGELAQWFNKFVDRIEKIVATIAQNANNLVMVAEELSESSEKVNASASQASMTVQEIARGGQSLSTSAADTYQQSNILIESIKTIASSAHDSAANATEVNNIARQGEESARFAAEKMDMIKSSVSSSAEVVLDLGQKSRQINEVIDVINDISEQTNLLALNAAIEAARAGEAGKGFAVVADEVRKLAEQSKSATKQIEEMIEEIAESTRNTVETMNVGTKEVEEGSKIVEEALSSLGIISGRISNLVDQIDKIGESTAEQLASSEKVQQAISDVSSIAEESAASSEEVAASTEQTTSAMQRISESAQELAANADELMRIVGQFKIGNQDELSNRSKAENGSPDRKVEKTDSGSRQSA
jgi:methyl-accepting chemotaxis protein